ncbi:Transcription initiation factor IID, 18kD subunit domain containing protein [Elaphomyces granulatus]
MMFICGDARRPSAETALVIEEIVQQQIIEMIVRCVAQLTRRGSRSISVNDLLFLIRENKAKRSRLLKLLSVKEMRKNIHASDDKKDSDTGDLSLADDELPTLEVAARASIPKKRRRKLTRSLRDVESLYPIQLDEDTEEEIQEPDSAGMLRQFDERTKSMSGQEYVYWSECRKASFTAGRAAATRFREWISLAAYPNVRATEDIIDMLGFLAIETVRTLTENALRVKEVEDFSAANRYGSKAAGKRKRAGPFVIKDEDLTPLQPRHVNEAYRRLQVSPKRAIARLLLNDRKVPPCLPLRLVSSSC